MTLRLFLIFLFFIFLLFSESLDHVICLVTHCESFVFFNYCTFSYFLESVVESWLLHVLVRMVFRNTSCLPSNRSTLFLILNSWLLSWASYTRIELARWVPSSSLSWRNRLILWTSSFKFWSRILSSMSWLEVLSWERGLGWLLVLWISKPIDLRFIFFFETLSCSIVLKLKLLLSFITQVVLFPCIWRLVLLGLFLNLWKSRDNHALLNATWDLANELLDNLRT